ncbi:unnamed protein product, partial [Mesorhabditis belari]|uniref:Uncharacterized protein n=1 Tax=Mesorhabditis belari TaxID=2138241 RepID=A0AAF3F0L9_9BILA
MTPKTFLLVLFGIAGAARSRVDVLEGDTVRFLPAGEIFQRDCVMGNQTITKCNEEKPENCGKWIDVGTGLPPIDEVGSETVWNDDELVIKNLQRADAGNYKDPETPTNEDQGEPLILEGDIEKIPTDGNTVITLIVHSHDD